MSYFKIDTATIRTTLWALKESKNDLAYCNLMREVYDIHYLEINDPCAETWLIARFVSDPKWFGIIMYPDTAIALLDDLSNKINKRGRIPMKNPDKFICWNENLCDMLLMRVVIRATEPFIESQINLEWFKREAQSICESCNCSSGFSLLKGFGTYYKDNYSINL